MLRIVPALIVLSSLYYSCGPSENVGDKKDVVLPSPKQLYIDSVLARCGNYKDTMIIHRDTVILKKDIGKLYDLQHFNFKRYEGKTIGELLENDTIKGYSGTWNSAEPPGVFNSFNLTYSRDLYLKIYTGKLTFQDNFSDSITWDIELLKKEKIASFEVGGHFFTTDILKKY